MPERLTHVRFANGLSMDKNLKINKNYEISYPRKAVYGAWLSPKAVVGPATKIEVNPTVGGHIRVHFRSDRGPAMLSGEFLVVKPREKLVYTWTSDTTGEETMVTIDFADCEKGTDIDIIHTGFISESSCVKHEAGWDAFIKGIEQYLASNN